MELHINRLIKKGFSRLEAENLIKIASELKPGLSNLDTIQFTQFIIDIDKINNNKFGKYK